MVTYQIMDFLTSEQQVDEDGLLIQDDDSKCLANPAKICSIVENHFKLYI
jgi:hypothetical protein